MNVDWEQPCRQQRDPVCGRNLTSDQTPLTAELKGHTYLFCSERCRTLFSIRPAWFVEREGKSDRRKAS